MSTFPPSSLYESWITRLRMPWMGKIGRRIWGGFAAALGDKTKDWLTQALLEHLPEYASAPSVALTASERQIDQGPTEASSDLATRLTKAVAQWQLAGSPLGTLMALHYAGFDGAVFVQQNGAAYSLSGPPDLDDPLSVLVTTACDTLSVALTSVPVNGSAPPLGSVGPRSIPAGNSWWTFDSDTDFCSRFAILFPGPILPSFFMTTGTAVFDGGEDIVGVEWSNPFVDNSYMVDVGPPVITDGSGGVIVWADGTDKSKTMTGIDVKTSARFHGYVDLIAYQVGANPFADLHPPDLSRLKSVISKWRPRKATCVGVYALVQGSFIGWPVTTIGGRTMGQSSIVSYQGGF